MAPEKSPASLKSLELRVISSVCRKFLRSRKRVWRKTAPFLGNLRLLESAPDFQSGWRRRALTCLPPCLNRPGFGKKVSPHAVPIRGPHFPAHLSGLCLGFCVYGPSEAIGSHSGPSGVHPKGIFH